MENYLICSLKNSDIFAIYGYFPHFLETWIYYLDLIVPIFFTHSFISTYFIMFESLLDSDRWNIYPYNYSYYSFISLIYNRFVIIFFMKISLKICKI